MNTECTTAARLPTQARLLALLAEYLLASPGVRHPGADGATVEEVVAAEYPAAAAAGHVPGPSELVRRHPELTEVIRGFFAT